MSVATKEKILRGLPVGSARVKQCKQLTGQHHKVDRHGDANDLNQRPCGLRWCRKSGRDAENSHDKDDKGGAADERRGQKSRGQQCRIPEWTATETAVEERSHGVNTDCPDDRKKHKRDIPLWVGLSTKIPHVEQVTDDVQIDHEISVQHNHVPRKH